ncbi:hypothetical protein HDV63DRAFT_214018 [Trichoderma sp. SZMC 28014]
MRRITMAMVVMRCLSLQLHLHCIVVRQLAVVVPACLTYWPHPRRPPFIIRPNDSNHAPVPRQATYCCWGRAGTSLLASCSFHRMVIPTYLFGQHKQDGGVWGGHEDQRFGTWMVTQIQMQANCAKSARISALSRHKRERRARGRKKEINQSMGSYLPAAGIIKSCMCTAVI